MPRDLQTVFRECLFASLRPLVRFCLKRSISVQQAIELLKQTFIEVAADELRKSGQSVNVSRLRVATGMHRRDVVRIFREGEVREHSSNLLSNVIGQWQQDRRFLTKTRKPKVLYKSA